MQEKPQTAEIPDNGAIETPTLSYTRNDGSIETAHDIQDAIRRCPFLGSLPVEMAEVYVAEVSKAAEKNKQPEAVETKEIKEKPVEEPEQKQETEPNKAIKTEVIVNVTTVETALEPISKKIETGTSASAIPEEAPQIPLEITEEQKVITPEIETQISVLQEQADRAQRLETLAFENIQHEIASEETRRDNLKTSVIRPVATNALPVAAVPFEQAHAQTNVTDTSEPIPFPIATEKSGEQKSTHQLEPLATEVVILPEAQDLVQEAALPQIEQKTSPEVSSEKTTSETESVEIVEEFTTLTQELVELFQEDRGLEPTPVSFGPDAQDQLYLKALHTEEFIPHNTAEHAQDALDMPSGPAAEILPSSPEQESLAEVFAEILLMARKETPSEQLIEITQKIQGVLAEQSDAETVAFPEELVSQVVELLTLSGIEKPAAKRMLLDFAKHHTLEEFQELLKAESVDLTKLIDYQHHLLAALRHAATSSSNRGLSTQFLLKLLIPSPIALQAA